MKIKSTGISNKSTGGGNPSSEGVSESIKHAGDQEEHFGRMSAGGVPSESVGRGVQEYPLEPKSSGVTGGNGGGDFQPVDAAHERVCKC